MDQINGSPIFLVFIVVFGKAACVCTVGQAPVGASWTVLSEMLLIRGHSEIQRLDSSNE